MSKHPPVIHSLTRVWTQPPMNAPRMILAFFALSLFFGLCVAALSQTLPVPTSESGAFSTRPLVPAEGEVTRLTITGEFPFTNGAIAVDNVQVAPELVTVDLVTAWATGAAPADEVATSWSVEVEVGDVSAAAYDIWVRVNGDNFIFSFFIVEAPRVDPAPLPEAVSTVVPRRSLGMNLSVLKDTTPMPNFVDVFKASRNWISHRPSDETWDTGAPFDLDDRGWVRSLAQDQEAGTLMMVEQGSNYLGGRYTVLYEGEGELYFDWDGRIIDAEAGRIELWVTPEIGIHLTIRQTNPDNYIRNIRVIMPGFEETYETEPFHPTYIQFLSQFSVLRFMDWADSNEPENNVPEVGEWSARITADHASQGTIRGVSLEYMIRMANEAGADPWINVPLVATDSYLDSMAAMLRDRLDPERKVYIEFSNEVWNPSFPQHHVAAARGTELGLADQAAADRFQFIFEDSESFANALRYHSQRSVEIFEIFEQVFGSRDRMVRVMGGWLSDSTELTNDVAEVILDWQEAYQKTDIYAIALYFGIYLPLDENVELVEGLSVDAILDTAEVDIHNLFAIAQDLKTVTDARAVELGTYEAGGHMVQATETPYPTELVEEKLTQAQAHPRLEGFYTTLLNGWADFGGHMNLYNDVLPYGGFGIVNSWNQEIETAHKYRAVQEFLLTRAAGALLGDNDGDGDVDFFDLFVFVDAFNTSEPAYDYDGSGQVNIFDLFIWADAFNSFNAGQ